MARLFQSPIPPTARDKLNEKQKKLISPDHPEVSFSFSYSQKGSSGRPLPLIPRRFSTGFRRR